MLLRLPGRSVQSDSITAFSRRHMTEIMPPSRLQYHGSTVSSDTETGPAQGTANQSPFQYSVQYAFLFSAVFLSRILSDAGDEIEIDDFPFAGFSHDHHTAIIDFFYDSLYAAII